MAKVFIEETTLTAIGDAIREKEGSSALVPVNDMADRISAISGGGGGEMEPIVLTGNCTSACRGPLAETYITKFSNTISTSGITDTSNMFHDSTLERIPFDLNVNDVSNLSRTLYNARNLKNYPKIRGTIKWNTSTTLEYMLMYCSRIGDLEDLFTPEMLEGFSTVKITSAYSCPKVITFNELRCLEKIPTWWYKFNINPESTAFPAINYSLYYNLFSFCGSLLEADNIPVWRCKGAQTSNMFSSCFSTTMSLRSATFELNPDTTLPYETNWKNQTIELAYAGYGSGGNLTSYNPNYTSDNKVIDDASYQALKNTTRWYTENYRYSHYNHDSAVATINSLPDTSAYLATAGGTNTIKFKGAAGELTDGGAINTLTAEEIAVATAKGWTVTMI